MLAAGLLLTGLVGCGDDHRSEVHALDTAPADPGWPRLTWAHGSTIHTSSRERRVDGRILSLVPSAHGWFVELAKSDAEDAEDTETRWYFDDGRELQPVPGDVDHVRVSADGGRAGWIDRQGPERPAGQVAEAVVVDLVSGDVVLRDASGMGGEDGDDLEDRYEELEPEFLGFDARHAYWRNASGHGETVRWDPETGAVEPAERTGDEEFPGLVGQPVDAYRGIRAVDMRSGGPLPLSYGIYSPDRTWAAELSSPGRLTLHDVADRRRLRIGFGGGAAYFGGWLPGDRFYAVTTAHRIEGWDPSRPDATRGRIEVCRLPGGRCVPEARVPGMRDVVVPSADALLG